MATPHRRLPFQRTPRTALYKILGFGTVFLLVTGRRKPQKYMNFDCIGIKRLLLVIWLILAGHKNAWAIPICEGILKDGTMWVQSVVKNANSLKDEGRDFELKINNSVATIKDLEIGHAEVIKVDRKLGEGAFSSLVAKVETGQGVKALKIYEDTKLQDIAPTFVIQNALAKKHMAPAITGFLSANEVAILIQRNPQMKNMLEGRPAGFGILMDYVEPNIDPPRGTPELEAQISEIESEMSRLRVVPAIDLDFVIDENNKLVLIDFDCYYHVAPNGTVFGLKTSRQKMSIKYLLKNSEYQYRIDNFGLDNLDWFYIDGTGNYSVRLSRTRKQIGLNP
ncbi:MAG: hypothetical protein AB7N80_00270 [Bdellovibrionales bacterium]